MKLNQLKHDIEEGHLEQKPRYNEHMEIPPVFWLSQCEINFTAEFLSMIKNNNLISFLAMAAGLLCSVALLMHGSTGQCSVSLSTIS